MRRVYFVMQYLMSYLVCNYLAEEERALCFFILIVFLVAYVCKGMRLIFMVQSVGFSV